MSRALLHRKIQEVRELLDNEPKLGGMYQQPYYNGAGLVAVPTQFGGCPGYGGAKGMFPKGISKLAAPYVNRLDQAVKDIPPGPARTQAKLANIASLGAPPKVAEFITYRITQGQQNAAKLKDPYVQQKAKNTRLKNQIKCSEAISRCGDGLETLAQAQANSVYPLPVASAPQLPIGYMPGSGYGGFYGAARIGGW